MPTRNRRFSGDQVRVIAENVQINYCTDDDVNGLRRFIHSHWRANHILARDELLLRWQYDSSRTTGGSCHGLSVLIAWEKDRIVGILGLIPFELNVRGNLVSAVWLSQWVVVPDARPRGVGLQLLWALKDLGYEAFFALGFDNQIRNIYSAIGFEVLLDVPRWVGVFDQQKSVALVRQACPTSNENARLNFCAEYSAEGRIDTRDGSKVYIHKWNEPLGTDWDSFWTEVLASEHIGTNKDSSYLNWRYFNHPSFKYVGHIASSYSTKEVLGLTVCRVERVRNRNERVLRVVEFISAKEAEGPLADSIFEVGRANEVAFADCYGTSGNLANGLRLAGLRKFETRTDGMNFPSFFQPIEAGHSRLQAACWLSTRLRADVGDVLALDEFYITKSDSDQDRPN